MFSSSHFQTASASTVPRSRTYMQRGPQNQPCYCRLSLSESSISCAQPLRMGHMATPAKRGSLTVDARKSIGLRHAGAGMFGFEADQHDEEEAFVDDEFVLGDEDSDIVDCDINIDSEDTLSEHARTGVVVEHVTSAELQQRLADRVKKPKEPADMTEFGPEFWAGLRAKGEGADIVLPADAQLNLNRHGYTAFVMAGEVEFLVAETEDGRLDLQDTFVYDTGAAYYSRPTVDGPLPEQPVHLHPIPWIERESADPLDNKPATEAVLRVYFVGVASLQPPVLALDRVYAFDAETRVLRREEVVAVGDHIQDPVLRIRTWGITIEDSAQAPPPHMVAMGEDEEEDYGYFDEDEEGEEGEAAAPTSEPEEEGAGIRPDQSVHIDEQPDAPSEDLIAG